MARAADGLGDDVLLIAVGALAPMALAVAERLRTQGIGVTVVDPRWWCRCRRRCAAGAHAQAGRHLEDNGVRGGVGSEVSATLRAAEIDVPCRDLGVPQEFLDHASRSEVLEQVGLTERNVARRVTGWVAAPVPSTSPGSPSRSTDRRVGGLRRPR